MEAVDGMFEQIRTVRKRPLSLGMRAAHKSRVAALEKARLGECARQNLELRDLQDT